MKNHYIPQFIINRFSTAVNVFNLNTAEIREKRPSNKIFFTRNIYKDEVEVALSRYLEAPFSKLLKSKLLTDNEIIITREDLFLIKKYMFVTSIRSQELDHFCYLLKSLNKNSNGFINFAKLEGLKNVSLKTSEEMLKTMTPFDFFNQQLLALAEFSTEKLLQPYEIFKDTRLSLEMACWACSFYFSYVAFWDAEDDSEFVLSDAGIVSEYEGFYQLTGGLSASKTSYLNHQIKKGDKNRIGAYVKPMQTTLMMYENYDLFNISSTRCIVAINPFFKLYDSKTETMIYEKDGRISEIYKVKVPDIWPAVIQNKLLFEVPKTNYLLKGLYLPMDTFEYKAKKLNKKEMIYINSLLINESKNWVGFNKPDKVFSAFEYCLEHESQYKSVTKSNEKIENIIVNYANNLMNSKFNDVIKWCTEQGCKSENDVVSIFEELLADIYKDFNENIYIYEFYLESYNDTYNLKQLDFLGNGDKQKKMKYLIDGYNRLLAERGGNL
ncbi:MAG: DUF4238 domain-containing protein [Bacilli bacterium]|nr:DUF4238 domain-containing protein [Bacilli bacterium]